jgi:hypothetical protein
MVLAQNSYEDQWNRTEDPDMNPHNYAHLIFERHQKHTIEKRLPLQQILLGKNGYLSAEN